MTDLALSRQENALLPLGWISEWRTIHTPKYPFKRLEQGYLLFVYTLYPAKQAKAITIGMTA